MENENNKMMTDLIEQEGELHYLSNNKYINPYANYSDKFNRFERGWTQAMKKSAVGLIKHRPNGFKSEYPLAFKSMPSYPSKSVSQQAEEYKRRKG